MSEGGKKRERGRGEESFLVRDAKNCNMTFTQDM